GVLLLCTEKRRSTPVIVPLASRTTTAALLNREGAAKNTNTTPTRPPRDTSRPGATPRAPPRAADDRLPLPEPIALGALAARRSGPANTSVPARRGPVPCRSPARAPCWARRR